MSKSAPHIYVIAGEESGDALGGRLISALKKENPACRFSGIGGKAMAAQGLSSLFPMQDLSVMGVFEILPRLPLLLRRIRECAEDILRRRPDIVVTIDSPDFAFRVVKAVRRQMKKDDGKDPSPAPAPLFYHMVAPTVWAWRPGRAKKVAKIYDGIFCLYPFEPPYFTAHGMEAWFIGHPMMESALHDADPASFHRAGKTVIGLLFGSRHGEIDRIGAAIAGAAAKIKAQKEDAVFLCPTLPHLADGISALLETYGLASCAQVLIPDTEDEKCAAFRAMNAAIAVSGTAGLELAVAGVPHVIAYRFGWLSWLLARLMIRVRYAHLGNILLDAPVVPEFLQEACTPGAISEAVLDLIDKDRSAARQVQCARFEEIRALLMPPDGQTSSSSAAAARVLCPGK